MTPGVMMSNRDLVTAAGLIGGERIIKLLRTARPVIIYGVPPRNSCSFYLRESP